MTAKTIEITMLLRIKTMTILITRTPTFAGAEKKQKELIVQFQQQRTPRKKAASVSRSAMPPRADDAIPADAILLSEAYTPSD